MYRYTLNKTLQHEKNMAFKKPHSFTFGVYFIAEKYARKYCQADLYHSTFALWRILSSGSEFVFYSEHKLDSVYINGWPFRSQMFQIDDV